MYEKNKILSNKQGTLFNIKKLIDSKFEPIIFTLNNLELLFDIQRSKNKIYLKWKLIKFVNNDKFA